MNKNLIIAAVLVIIALGGGFLMGMQYEKSKAPSYANGPFMMGGNGQMRGRFGSGQNAAFRPVRGQVLSVDNTGLTVKLSDGSSKIVVVAPSTVFVKSSTASASDVKSGDTIVVVGTANSDGSVTAQNVQINPPVGMMRVTAPTGTQ